MEFPASQSILSTTVTETCVSTQSGFLLLPLELRQSIYALAINTIGTFGKRPQEPPISYVSRQLREEVLPIYYRSYPLTIQAYIKCHSHGNTFLTTNRWYHRLETSKLSHMRTLKPRFGFMEAYFGETVTIEFTIQMSKQHGNYQMTHSFGAGWYTDVHRKGDPADCEEVLQLLRAHVCGELNALIARPGIGCFTAKDLDRLVALDPDTLP